VVDIIFLFNTAYIDLTQDTPIEIDNTQEKKIKKEEEDKLEDKILQQAITLPIGTTHDNLKSENSSTNDEIVIKEDQYCKYTYDSQYHPEEEKQGLENKENNNKEEDNNDDESTYLTDSDDTDLFGTQPDTFHFIDKERFGTVLTIGDDYFITVIDIQPTDQQLRPKRLDTSIYVSAIDLSLPNNLPILFQPLRQYYFFCKELIPIQGHTHYQISKSIFPQFRGQFPLTACFYIEEIKFR
jgi:hypothetical protein